jgi:hypothetical protein
MKGFRSSILVLGVVCLFISCTPYVITTPLKVPFDSSQSCAIGAITDELPAEMDIDKKPTLEEISMFKDELDYALHDNGIFQMVDASGDAEYEVTGGVLVFKRGSGVVRFLIGFGIGNAKLTVALRLIDKADSSKVVFAGNFSAEVADWATKGDQMYKTTARNFAKALKKELKRINKEAESKD